MKNKNILIMVTGSIAAYKACEIIRLLRKEGANVQVMMSESAQKFIGKATFAALSGSEVLTKLFPNTPKAGLEHIQNAIELDAIIVLPATANIICKAANGVADEIISTTLSICEQPTLFAPAMNFRMWQNPATQEAIEKLKERGKYVLNPEEGLLASLHEGEGRLPKIKKIMNGIRSLFDIPTPLDGKKILITAGPTRESIDPVRFISNKSSGKMGYALASKAKDMGAEVILISGPVNLSPIPGIELITIENTMEMNEAVNSNVKKMDYVFMSAAIADFLPLQKSNEKIKRSSNDLVIKLQPAPDILKSIHGKSKAIIIAFALETHDGEKEALRKLNDKKADYIILNYANEEGAGFESSTNRVLIFDKQGNKHELKKDRKDRIAEKIISYVLTTQTKHVKI